MSALEARNAEVLVDHQRMSSAACLCGWAELGKSHPEHQAAALAPVIREAQAEAWDDCVAVADGQWVIGHSTAQLLRNTNPHRSNDE